MNVLCDAHNTIHVMDQAERDLAKAKAEDAREEATLKLQLNRWDRERREAEAKAQHEAWQRGQAAPIAPKPASAAAPTQAQQEAEAISTFEWQQLIKELLNGVREEDLPPPIPRRRVEAPSGLPSLKRLIAGMG